MVTANTDILVIAGIPASGKSTFARKLQKEGFYYISLNGEDDAARTEQLQRDAYLAYRRGDTERLLELLSQSPGPVVVEYGFPPDEGNLQVVRGLRGGGARFVWFECPNDVARGRYRKRERGRAAAMAAFDRQIALIEERRDQITAAANPQFVQVLRGKAPKGHDELRREIFNDP
jgi:predicted kinase